MNFMLQKVLFSVKIKCNVGTYFHFTGGYTL